MRISDWSSDVCSSDLRHQLGDPLLGLPQGETRALQLRLSRTRLRALRHRQRTQRVHRVLSVRDRLTHRRTAARIKPMPSSPAGPGTDTNTAVNDPSSRRPAPLLSLPPSTPPTPTDAP